MYKHFVVVLFVITVAKGQTWVSRARLRDHHEYWMTMMQNLVNELEKREWCNLKLNNITQQIDDSLYNFHVAGTVRYVNGFVVSIQKIDIVDINQLITSRTIGGEAVPFGTVRGKINFRDMMVGYDVEANLTSPEDPSFRSTGTFLHTLVQLHLDVTQNMLTKKFSSSASVNSVSEGSGVRMQYLPSNNITEVLGRRFSASTFNSASLWADNIFQPILLELADKIGFPDVCFSNCT